MESKKILSHLFLAALGIVFLFSARGPRSMPAHLSILGAAIAADPSALSEKINEQFQNLAEKNAQLQTLLDRADFLLNFSRTLKKGMSGQDVKILQQNLNQLPDLNLDVPATGYFGKFTENAVKTFQDSQDLAASGIFDRTTEEKLAETAVAPADAQQVDIIPDLQYLLSSQQSVDLSGEDANAIINTSSDASLFNIPIDQTPLPDAIPLIAPVTTPSPAPVPTSAQKTNSTTKNNPTPQNTKK